ncbi:MAG TPA: small multi-drug export protein [archaeon]|nr:small multi-drug export protein [archaeon]
MDLMMKLLTVFGIGIIELWAAIPAGFALDLHPVTIGLIAAIGAMVGAGTVLVLGERVRNRLIRHSNPNAQHGRIYQIWQSYGVIGLGLLAPLLTGAPLGVAVGLTLGAPTGRLLFWICIGIVIWSIILTFLGVLGLAGINSLRN